MFLFTFLRDFYSCWCLFSIKFFLLVVKVVETISLINSCKAKYRNGVQLFSVFKICFVISYLLLVLVNAFALMSTLFMTFYTIIYWNSVILLFNLLIFIECLLIFYCLLLHSTFLFSFSIDLWILELAVSQVWRYLFLLMSWTLLLYTY